VKAIARNHKVHVLTAAYQRTDIEKALPEHPELAENAVFHYIPWYCPKWLDRIWPPMWLWVYRVWQRRAYRLGRRLHEEVGFDLVHLVTYVGFRTPGHLWKLDVPFVWGPIGGLENTPWRLLPMMGVRGAAYYGARNIVNSLHKRFMRLPKRAFAKAAGRGAIIAATEGIRREIRRWYGHESQVICEIGTPGEVAATHSVREPGQPLRLAWSGLHLPGKALPLLLRAVAALPADVDWRLDILGGGPCTARWKRQAVKLGVEGRCTWHGWVPRDKALSVIRGAHLFAITSLKDLTSTVLLEAISQGVPVVSLDHCGFSDVLEGSCGVRIPVTTQPRMAEDFAAAILRLWRDEAQRVGLAAGARATAEAFTWEAKADTLAKVYGQAERDRSSPGPTKCQTRPIEL
jgi:glycosyltransferase involved in cell wall biosynthesis